MDLRDSQPTVKKRQSPLERCFRLGLVHFSLASLCRDVVAETNDLEAGHNNVAVKIRADVMHPLWLRCLDHCHAIPTLIDRCPEGNKHEG